MDKQLTNDKPKIGLSGTWLIEPDTIRKKRLMEENPESEIFIWYCEICGAYCGGNRTESNRRCKSCQSINL